MTSSQQEALKYLAVVFMVLDHVGAILLDDFAPLRMVGRLALPLFGYLMAYNLTRRNVSPSRYYRPLAVLLVVSIVPHYLAFGGSSLNVFAILLAGVLVYDAATGSHRWPAIGARLALAVALASVGEYGIPGALLVPTFALALRRMTFSFSVPVLFVLVWLNAATPWLLIPLAVIPMIWLIERLDVRLERMPRWLWYGFYPAHLLVLALVSP